MTDKSTLNLPDGFTARGASHDDAESIYELNNHYAKETIGANDVSVEDIHNMYSEPGFNPATDVCLVFSPNQRLVGYSEAWTTANPPVHPFLWSCVHPDFWGRGIGTYILSWGEQRALQVMERVPADLRISVRTGAAHVIVNARTLFENTGWKHIRSNYTMRIDLDGPPPAPVWPQGLEIRSFKPEDAEPVYRAQVDAFRDHFGFVEQPFDKGFARFRHGQLEDPLHDPSLWFIAWDGDDVAGICLCRSHSHEDRDCGYVHILGVRRAWRKHGLGLAFLNHAFGEFMRRGQDKVTLGVDASNLTGALHLYQKAGMRVHRQFDLYEKELRPGKEISVEHL